MMGIYGFRGGPVYAAGSPQQRLLTALDQPLSPVSTFLGNAGEAMETSYGLGSILRDFSTPRAPRQLDARTRDAARMAPTVAAPLALVERAYEGVRSIFGAQATGEPMDEATYKASPYFRDSIPFESGLTEDRAAALALMADTKAVREFYARKQPVAAFIGTLAGSAADPLNFIPIAGPVVKAAAVAKFGRIGGAAVAASLDAASNVAVAGALTAPMRAGFGDDVSWQAQVSDIAMAAMIGGVFGAGEGVVTKVRGDRAAQRELAIKAATDQLQTLKRVQEARIALNDGAVSLALDGEVKLSPNATDAMSALAREVIPDVVREREPRPASAEGLSPEVATSVPAADVLPRTTPEPALSGLERALNDLRSGKGFADVSMKRPVTDMLKRLGGVDPDSPLAAELKTIGVTSKSAPGLFRREAMTVATENGPVVRQPLRAVDNLPMSEVGDRFAARGRDDGAGYVSQQSIVDAIKDEVAGDPWLTPAEQARFDEIRKPVEDLDEFLNRFGIDVEGRTNAEVMADIRSVEQRLTSGFGPSPGRADAGMDDAEIGDWSREWAADEKPATMNAQWRIDPSRGGYLEEGELRQLLDEDQMAGGTRLSEADREELAAADRVWIEADAFGKALQAAVTCLL